MLLSHSHLAMGQNPVPLVNIPKIGSKMGGAPTPKWDPKTALSHSHFSFGQLCGALAAKVQKLQARPSMQPDGFQKNGHGVPRADVDTGQAA